MDLVTIAGLVLAFGLIIGAIINGGPLTAFYDLSSVLIVVLGSGATMMVAFPGKRLRQTISVVRNAFTSSAQDPEQIMQLLQTMSNRVRRDGGLLALDDMTAELNDEYLKRGVQMIVDGYDPQAIQEVLYLEIEKLSDRHEAGIELFEALGAYAPALGMIGTLVGLVQMLQALDSPDTIGPSMAVALLTTFYGAVIANVVAIPLARRLRVRSEEEIAEKVLMAHGLLSILAGENPRFLTERLNVQLPPLMRAQEAS